ncbi:MAG: 4Fe-4S binding protein [Prevotellaceae bacterium]|jgi:polyferredoxin|nr:4Fe-4S binding protein [Prevotellaceae bacterium]
MYSLLRRLRVVLSIGIFFLIFFCFINVYHFAGSWWTMPLGWQLIPAILAGSFAVVIVLLLLTLLFGRIYCSTLCPLGTYQDIVRRVTNLFKSKKARRMKYHKPHNIARYAILVISVMATIMGSSILLLWLDPYSNFGRVAANLFNPVIIFFGNNLSYIIDIIPVHGYHSFTLSAIIAAIIFFIIITVFSALRGRLYCNLICPVGSFLGLISKYSLFKLQINAERCTHCTICSKECKAQCIDVGKQEIDNSRCVQCYDCTVSCKLGAIGYKQCYKIKQPTQPMNTASERRSFLGALGGIIAAGTAGKLLPPLRNVSENNKAICPPGSEGLERFKAHCTSCHACIANCPSHVLRPAITEYGIDGFTMPVLDFDRSYCNYECTRCSEICPNDAICTITQAEKAVIQIGEVKFLPKRCIVVSDETDCGACDEHCPTHAIKMIDFRNGLKLPKVNRELCIGCGGCEYICPASPKAIFVVANTVHEAAVLYQEKEQKEIKVEGFGF